MFRSLYVTMYLFFLGSNYETKLQYIFFGEDLKKNILSYEVNALVNRRLKVIYGSVFKVIPIYLELKTRQIPKKKKKRKTQPYEHQVFECSKSYKFDARKLLLK